MLSDNNKRLGAALLATLSILALASDYSNPKLYIQGAIAFVAAYWQIKPTFSAQSVKPMYDQKALDVLEDAKRRSNGKL